MAVQVGHAQQDLAQGDEDLFLAHAERGLLVDESLLHKVPTQGEGRGGNEDVLRPVVRGGVHVARSGHARVGSRGRRGVETLEVDADVVGGGSHEHVEGGDHIWVRREGQEEPGKGGRRAQVVGCVVTRGEDLQRELWGQIGELDG